MEVWKDITGYEGIYQVSNAGKVKALARTIKAKSNSERTTSEVEIQPDVNYNGYLSVRLVKNGVRMRHRVHLLVWDAFGTKKRNGKSIVVDHIDNNKTNCHISNLQLLTGRDNIIKGKQKEGHLTGTCRVGNIWYSRIRIGNIRKYLGSFPSALEAHTAYLKEKQLVTIKI